MILNRMLLCGVMAFISCLLLTACATSRDTNNSIPTQPTLVHGTSLASTPGVGPTVILTPTKVPGGNAHSQLVTLPDRVLSISSVSKQAGTDSGSTIISLTITIKNTSGNQIDNEATYFQLADLEGDMFGLASKPNSNFFGTIAPQSSRSGTIIFQVPTGAISGLHLLYRPEITTETVSIPLNLS